MKTFSAVRVDNTVVIDGVGKPVDCSSLDPTIHAIQWNEEKQRGHIEYVDEDPNDSISPPNENIDSIAPYQSLVDAWEAYIIAPPDEGLIRMPIDGLVRTEK